MGQLINSSKGTYEREEKLGEGAFGEVFKVRNRHTGKRYALKVIKCSSNEDLTNVMDEMTALSKLSHPNIIRLFESEHKQDVEFCAEIFLLFEYCTGGTLSERLSRPSTKGDHIQWMHQLADAVSYMHARNLVHRDLKPDNILLTHEPEDIKIGDFGLSRNFVTTKQGDQTWESYYMVYGCGTLFYMAPEVFEGHYTEKADVFALGVLFYAILERTYKVVEGTKYFGAFVQDNQGNTTALGFQMSEDKYGLRVTFEKTEHRVAEIVCSALLFDQKMRPSAAEIQEKLNEYVSV